ncbi:Thioredoxin C-1 [Pigmentiphaga humi]|uniref:Thioredoxin C-1 n=1 Tax=Pigmentiphaga humi TaxID=2478468 RepID=A0A3P4B290_9BURK|nr:thioredoxin family protein [Pigmentiphaga humi]VCU70172.1 Thioredoxin C-1 [Pigmentiphaga humi]
MPFSTVYSSDAPSREEVDAWQEPAVLEFGTNWCGYCQAAQPAIAQAFAGHESVRHVKVEDGKGRPLGRSFAVKLWPTLIFLDQGREVARLVRPADPGAITDALTLVDRPHL